MDKKNYIRIPYLDLKIVDGSQGHGICFRLECPISTILDLVVAVIMSERIKK